MLAKASGQPLCMSCVLIDEKHPVHGSLSPQGGIHRSLAREGPIFASMCVAHRDTYRDLTALGYGAQ